MRDEAKKTTSTTTQEPMPESVPHYLLIIGNIPEAYETKTGIATLVSRTVVPVHRKIEGKLSLNISNQ